MGQRYHGTRVAGKQGKGKRRRSGAANSRPAARNPKETRGHGASPVQLPADPEELKALMREAMETFAIEVGLLVAAQVLQDEVASYCGRRYKHLADRRATRYGRQRGVVMMAGQKLPIKKPRARWTDGSGEVELETYRLMQNPEAMPAAS